MRAGGINVRFASTLIFVLVFAAAALAEWQNVGNVTTVTQVKPSGVVFSTSSRAVGSVEFFDLDVIRVHTAPSGKFERDFSYAIDYSIDRHTPAIRVVQSAAQIVLTNAFGTRVVIHRTPFRIEIFDAAGQLVVGDDPKNPVRFDRTTGEFVATKTRSSEVETYYGFGEKAFIEMSRNGKHIINWNTDTFAYPIGTDPIYQSIPFFYALNNGKAYGLFLNNTFRSFFDMGKTSPDRYSFGANGGELDYFVFTGGTDRSPKKVIEHYTRLTGRTPLPPIWALGNQQSRWSYFPEKRVREIAEGFRKNRIPADVIYLDVDYMDEYRVFTWDQKRFPDPPKLIGDLKKDGFRTVLIIDPGIKVDPNYHAYADGRSKSIFVKNPDGSELNRDVWPKASAFPDFTDAKAREWFGALYRQHLDEGIAGFWTDMNEPGVFLTERSPRPEIAHHPEKTFPYDTPHAGDGLPDTHRRYHNVYGMQMARATFEGVRKLEPDGRPFVLTRAGFAGVQRYAAVWTGDNVASWEHLALTIPMLANISVSGIPFVGADVGGFAEMPSGELYARWLQAGALTPFLRSHSVGWVGNKEPWEFGEEFTKINRATVELRYQFLPYIYSLFREHERTGAPVMRPLWYEFPADKQTYLIADQFMLGGDLLVAPVVKEGMRTRGIYLPADAEWIDWWTGAKLESGKTHYPQTPLDRLPIFIRVGSVVPTQSVIQHTGEMLTAAITLNIAAGIRADHTETATLFQDAGEGYGYRRSEWREIEIVHKRGSLSIKRIGSFNGQRLGSVEVRGIGESPKEITADGRRVDFDFQPEMKRLSFRLRGNEKEILLVR
ncbi:MAG TPA: glycoside hydrolase family 31 protein [Pyrinomonadaceae bacterium]|nr:glycoside hydrolase family 31 protein [Pyrinomonadaceae bacterium]